jgi:hypothetical protein
MHKIGVMLMGKSRESPKKVKEIILEVEGKTKMLNIAEYLLELGKIQNTNVEFSLEKNGQPINDISNITQASKYTAPINGVIKLFMYEKEDPQTKLNESRQNLNEEAQQNQNLPSKTKGIPESAPTVDTNTANPPLRSLPSGQTNQGEGSKQQPKAEEVQKGCCCF